MKLFGLDVMLVKDLVEIWVYLIWVSLIIENVFQTSFKMNKQTRLEYGDSEMTHAMLLTGVDVKNRKSAKWKIENSWGTKSGNKGYMMMTDEWFDEYTYEVVVDKKYLSKKLLKYLDIDPITLAPWDPMGALA